MNRQHQAQLAARCASILLLAGAFETGCTPDIGHDPVPDAMEFDPQSAPPRVPQPIGLIVNPATGRIDFALAGTPLPSDCEQSTALSPAECAFDHYLETLDGFPTVTPAAAPTTAEIDPESLEVGRDLVVLSTREPSLVPELRLGFDLEHRQLTVRPQPSWSLGENYWIAVRGYDNGVRARSGAEIVGTPTMALLKQETSLTCGAQSLPEIDPECPAFRLLAQNQPESDAKVALLTLEMIRASYQKSGIWQRMAAAGLPKEQIAVLWNFPTHSSSVPELDPNAGLLPRATSDNQLRVAVRGPVAPDTVTAFVVREQAGSVVLMDLTAAASGDLVAGFPRASASYAEGEIVITGAQPFARGHQYGVFITHAVRDPSGKPLVPSPVTVLLTSKAPVADGTGNSLVSSVSNSDAAALEAGRQQLATLFDNPVFAALTGFTRQDLVYCFAFSLEAP